MIDLNANPTPWWQRLFSPYEMTDRQGEGTRVSGALVSAARDVATTLRTGVPGLLRLGPRDRTNVTGGSGILVTNGKEYGILTAGHVAHNAVDAANEGRPLWAAITQAPDRVEQRRATRGRVTVNVSGRTRWAGLNIIAPAYRAPEGNYGRTDLGVLYLPTGAAEAACKELHVSPFNLNDHDQVATENPLHGLHIALGAPLQCDGRDGEPFVLACHLAACRTYTSGGFNYLGYGVNPDNSTEELDWHGFSGGPTWALQPTADAVKKDRDGEREFTAKDFSTPRLAGILCYQKARESNNLNTPDGFRHEVYAHVVDAKVLACAAEMLAMVAAKAPTAPSGRIVVDTINDPV